MIITHVSVTQVNTGGGQTEYNTMWPHKYDSHYSSSNINVLYVTVNLRRKKPISNDCSEIRSGNQHILNGIQLLCY